MPALAPRTPAPASRQAQQQQQQQQQQQNNSVDVVDWRAELGERLARSKAAVASATEDAPVADERILDRWDASDDILHAGGEQKQQDEHRHWRAGSSEELVAQVLEDVRSSWRRCVQVQ